MSERVAGRETPWLWVYCVIHGCGHYAAVPLVPLIIRWGPDDVGQRICRDFRCSHCGGREPIVRGPSWAGQHIGWSPIADGRQRWTGAELYPGPLSLHYLDYRCFGFKGDQDYHPVLGYFNFNTMCNLYSITRSRDEIRGLFRVSGNRAYAFEPMPAIFPKSVAPIVRLAEDGERELVPATWGFPLLKQGYAPKPVTNVRDDKVLTSPFWRPSFEVRRCLVPASSYCEPDSNKRAGWHWFALKDKTEPRPLFAFPGIWKCYTGPMKKDGPTVEVDVYAFMTTTPNELTATIMHGRMPVLLSDETDFDAWLSAPPDEAYRLVRSYEAERMRIVQSGADKIDLLATSTPA